MNRQAALTPTPGGVGPVTLSVLIRNTVHAAKRQLHGRKPRLPADLDRIFVRDLELMARIGIYAQEEAQPQAVRINLELEAERGGDGLGVVCYAEVAETVRALAAGGHIRLVEELAERIAAACLDDLRVHAVRVRVEKLNAVAGSAGVGVEIHRRRS